MEWIPSEHWPETWDSVQGDFRILRRPGGPYQLMDLRNGTGRLWLEYVDCSTLEQAKAVAQRIVGV